MIIVDMEASGVDPHKHSLVSVGALDFDNPENQFYEECHVWEGAHIDDEALKVNGFSKKEITDKNKESDKDLAVHFLEWAKSCVEHTIAGQNPSADRDFLRITAERYHINWPLAYRTVDLHSVCFSHMIKRGLAIPVVNKRSDLNLDKIMSYVGLDFGRGAHNALEDTKIEAETFSRLFYDKILLSEFKKYPIPWIS